MRFDDKYRVYYIKHPDGQFVPYVHISVYAQATNHSMGATRSLLERHRVPNGEGGISKRRPLKYIRDGSTLWIPTIEITGYPFIKGTNVYHYTEDGKRYLCEKCTFTTELCEAAKIAEDLQVPESDS